MAKASRKVSPRQKNSPVPGSPASSSALVTRFGFPYPSRTKAEEESGDQSRICDTGSINVIASEEPKERPDRLRAIGTDEAIVPTVPCTTSHEVGDVEIVHPAVSRESNAAVTRNATERAVGLDGPASTENGANVPTSPSVGAIPSSEIKSDSSENSAHPPPSDRYPAAKEISRRETIANKISSVDQSVRPTPGSIAQLAAAAAQKRAARQANDDSQDQLSIREVKESSSPASAPTTHVMDIPPSSPSRVAEGSLASSPTDETPEHPTTSDGQSSGSTASVHRTQVADSPPNSPSRIASMLATKLFGWSTPKEPDEAVEEVDV